MGWVQSNLLNIGYVVILAVVVIWLSGVVKNLIVKLGKKNRHLDETLFHFLGLIARYAVLTFAGLIILDRFGVKRHRLSRSWVLPVWRLVWRCKALWPALRQVSC